MRNNEFTFTWEGANADMTPWEHLRVVSFEGREALGALYRYELVLLAREPATAVDPEEFVLARATLRIVTTTEPALRYVHGVIMEAEEIGPTSAGVLYRVVLMPPLVRAAHRTRCRVFLEKTTREIIEAVLLGESHRAVTSTTVDRVRENDRDLAAARELYTWRVQDASRIDTVAARPYCVQYNESDLAFLCRILEEEGIAFHFENGPAACVLVLSDTDQGRARLDPFLPLGPGKLGRHLGSMRLGKRLRASKVALVDYNWKKPALDMSVHAPAKVIPSDLFASSFPGLYPDAPGQGEPLAKTLLERLQTEASYAVGESSCRVLFAGAIFRLEHEASRSEGEYLVTALNVRGEAIGELPPELPFAMTGVPYATKLECARRGTSGTIAESRFRPARATPKPRILGSQTAFVTAEPSARGAEIHVGGPEGAEIGCVRLKFHWDREAARHAKEPSSCWVRVSQLFAGAGEGAVWHPRVGTEVVVEFLDGDPDRPLVTGRVYNGANRPPASGSGSPTVSLFKSMSSPGGATFNELSFDDAAGKEHVKLHAGRDYSTTVGHDRAESITNNSTSSVQVDRKESTGGNRSTAVTGNNTETVSGNESLSVSGNQSVSIAGNQSTSVGVDQSVNVAANRTVAVGADERIVIGANRAITIAGNRRETVNGDAEQSILGNTSVSVSGSSDESVSGNRSVTVAGTLTHSVSGAVTHAASADRTDTVGANMGIMTGGNFTLLAGAEAAFQGAMVHVTALGEIVLSAGGSAIKISGAGVEITGATVKVAGGSVDMTGGVVKVN